MEEFISYVIYLDFIYNLYNTIYENIIDLF